MIVEHGFITIMGIAFEQQLCQICHRASLLMTGLNPFLALDLSQKWQNKRVWKMLLQCNSSMGWHRAIVNVIDLHLRSFQLNWRRQRKSSWTPSRLTNLDPFSILQLKQHLLCGFARCANKFWLNKEKKCWCQMYRGNKCLFYLSDPKTEIGNSFDMTFSGMTFFNNCLLDCKNKHICMDKRQTGTNIPMRIVCVVVNKKPQSWEEMTFGRVCHAKGHGLRK